MVISNISNRFIGEYILSTSRDNYRLALCVGCIIKAMNSKNKRPMRVVPNQWRGNSFLEFLKNGMGVSRRIGNGFTVTIGTNFIPGYFPACTIYHESKSIRCIENINR